MGSLWLWYRTLGSVAVETVHSPQSEMFYWVTIMFSQTLGTALGNWTADEKVWGLDTRVRRSSLAACWRQLLLRITSAK